VLGIEIIRKGKGMEGLQPTVIGETALVAASNLTGIHKGLQVEVQHKLEYIELKSAIFSVQMI
jgi:hypothetical protein